MIQLNIKNGDYVYLTPYKVSEEGENPARYDLLDDTQKVWVELAVKDNHLEVVSKEDTISESDESMQAILDDLLLELIKSAQSGTDGSDTDTPPLVDPYDPESIKVQTKPFNLTLISNMIDKGYIDLSPDFQRNLVWNNFQKSRLIESILLRIPLPMFYFAEDGEGNISVVDGLQRLTTLKDFMDNKFNLKGLEYLGKTCDNCYYSDSSKGKVLSPKYLKWFDMTQLTVNVIDPSSPSKVKYDIFRRINTGGKPLNNQEIRNCLASKSLREVLRSMIGLPEFKEATDYSIKSTRMEDMEVALRFICFHRMYLKDETLSIYNGNMEYTLDTVTEELGKLKKEELLPYIDLYSKAMKNASHLFGGRYAFRKILPQHLEPKANKQLINKALFVSWSVLLSYFNPENLSNLCEKSLLARPLSEEIDKDRILYNYLSFGTNGKANLQYAFSTAKKLLKDHLKN